MALLLSGIICGAQERIPALDKGTWYPAPAKGISFQRAGYFGFTQQQQLQMRANMARVIEQIHQTPVLNPPRGFSAGAYASLCEYGCEDKKVMTGESGVIFLEYYRSGNNPQAKVDEEGPSLKVYFNSIATIVSNNGLDKDDYFEEPIVTDHIQGFPVYRNLVAITKNKEPLFVPLTKERYLQLAIAAGKKQVEELKKTAANGSPYQQWLKTRDAGMKGFLEGLDMLAKSEPAKAKAAREKYLKEMQRTDSMYKADEAKFLRDQQAMIDKPEAEVRSNQRQLDAYTAEEKGQPMLSRNGRPYMQCNPAFFNKSLPPYAVQLILIDLYKYQQGNTVILSKRHVQLMKDILGTIDLAKLQATLQY
jgi:hypothetical protein